MPATATFDEAISTVRRGGPQPGPGLRGVGRRDRRDPLREGPPAVPDGRPPAPRPELRTLLRTPVYIPESMTIDDLLHEFQRRKVHIAIVLDEYGGTAGLVTIEDLLEEIVGEIQDEYDTEEPMVVRAVRRRGPGRRPGVGRRARRAVRHRPRARGRGRVRHGRRADLPPDRRHPVARRPGRGRRADADGRVDRRAAGRQGARRPDARRRRARGRRGRRPLSVSGRIFASAACLAALAGAVASPVVACSAAAVPAEEIRAEAERIVVGTIVAQAGDPEAPDRIAISVEAVIRGVATPEVVLAPPTYAGCDSRIAVAGRHADRRGDRRALLRRGSARRPPSLLDRPRRRDGRAGRHRRHRPLTWRPRRARGMARRRAHSHRSAAGRCRRWSAGRRDCRRRPDRGSRDHRPHGTRGSPEAGRLTC